MASSVSDGLIVQLREVFTPMDKGLKENLIKLIREEMDQRPIIAFASDVPRTVYEEIDIAIEDDDGNPIPLMKDGAAITEKDDDGNEIPVYLTRKKWIPVERVNTWALGAPSPSDPNCTIFAMVMHENIPAIIAWSVKRTEVDDGVTYEYFHERIRNFHIAQGPCAAKALYLDMLASLTSDEAKECPHCGEALDAEPLDPKTTNGGGAQARA